MKVMRSLGKGYVGVLVILFFVGILYYVHRSQALHRSRSSAGFSKYLLHGFEPEPSRLFVDDGRFARLVAALAPDGFTYSGYYGLSSDGTSLRLSNTDRTQALVIAKGETARVIETPLGSFLNDRGVVVAWDTEYRAQHKITFHTGETVFAPRFAMDASGRYFCYGGTYFDYEAGERRTMPVQIARVDDPENPLVTSQIDGILSYLCVAENSVFVVARSNTGEMPNRLLCEEYVRQDSSLLLKRQFEMVSPYEWAGLKVGVNFLPRDFDPVSRSFLLSLSRDMPLGRVVWYVHDIDTGQFREMGVFEGYAGFLDREIFDRCLEDVSTEQPDSVEHADK